MITLLVLFAAVGIGYDLFHTRAAVKVNLKNRNSPITYYGTWVQLIAFVILVLVFLARIL